ncbi:MAG: DNA repair protein RadC [Treponema sp.]|nr:DNA repair protein RadC [Treponema sp.]
MTYNIISTRKLKKEIKIRQPIDIYFFLQRYAKNRKEQFFTITLDGEHKVIGIHIVSIGIANQTIVHPREVYYHAIKDNACALIFAHNHPSGQLAISPPDEEITDRLKSAGKIMGFHIIDHLIFNKKSFLSMRENGYFNQD